MTYLAHIRDTDQREQTVAAHCQQTAARAARFAEPVNLQSFAKLLGLLHDVGKCTSDFNAYLHGDAKFARGEIDHSFAGAKYLFSLVPENGTDLQKKVARLGAHCILSHHGLHDWLLPNQPFDYCAARIAKTESYAEVLANVFSIADVDTYKALFEAACAEYEQLDGRIQTLAEEIRGAATTNCLAKAKMFCWGMAERLLQSILMDADRVDTADFMSNTQTEQHWDLPKLWAEMEQRLDEKRALFATRTDPISLQRQNISDRCAAFATHPVGVCKLIVPTGGGKTLSSMRFAIAACRRENSELRKIIYVAPFLSILEQNSAEIRALAGEDAFLEHHSNVGAALTQADKHEALQAYELHAEIWDSPVIATTMVQFLNALFDGKTGSVRRMHRLAHAVIVIDEVQSIPLQCTYLFQLAINFLSRICGCTVVLCSATQPPFERQKAFPLLLDAQSSMTGDTAEDFAVFHRTTLRPMQKTGAYSYDDAAAFCAEQFAAHGNLLVIVNTKQAARQLHEKLCAIHAASGTSVPVYHLSTALCAAHRKNNIAAIKERLANHLPVICVTTQLIEAGVDISFGCVVRAMAGLDHAAQAAGRCNRNGEYPEVCPVYLLFLREENLQSLQTIKDERDTTMNLLYTITDNDALLDVQTMDLYYEKRYTAQEAELSFPVKGLNTNLVSLLSTNEPFAKELLPPALYKTLRRFGQAFATAGAQFAVIDKETDAVLVPYNDTAAKQIEAIRIHANNPVLLRKLLREAQLFSVNLYAEQKRKLLAQNALDDSIAGLLILDKRCYDQAYGVTFADAPMDFCAV